MKTGGRHLEHGRNQVLPHCTTLPIYACQQLAALPYNPTSHLQSEHCQSLLLTVTPIRDYPTLSDNITQEAGIWMRQKQSVHPWHLPRLFVPNQHTSLRTVSTSSGTTTKHNNSSTTKRFTLLHGKVTA